MQVDRHAALLFLLGALLAALRTALRTVFAGCLFCWSYFPSGFSSLDSLHWLLIENSSCRSMPEYSKLPRASGIPGPGSRKAHLKTALPDKCMCLLGDRPLRSLAHWNPLEAIGCYWNFQLERIGCYWKLFIEWQSGSAVEWCLNVYAKI